MKKKVIIILALYLLFAYASFKWAWWLWENDKDSFGDPSIYADWMLSVVGFLNMFIISYGIYRYGVWVEERHTPYSSKYKAHG